MTVTPVPNSLSVTIISSGEYQLGSVGEIEIMKVLSPEGLSRTAVGSVPARTLPVVIIKSVLGLLVATALCGCSGLLFFPANELVRTPAALGLEYQNVELTAADGTLLHAWWLPAVEKPRGTILFLHGNAENISTHIHNVRWLPASGYQVLLLDYRGFGRSAGKPRLPEVFLDIDAAMRWLANAPETADQPLFIFGQSIGASLMLYAATGYVDQPGLCGLISDAAFTGYGDIGRHAASQAWLTWPLQYPIAWGLNNGYDPIDAVAQLDSLPILFFHSPDDQIIPFAYMGQLANQHRGFSQQVETFGPHTATFNMDEFQAIMLEFMSNHRCTDNHKAVVMQ